jgi:nucleoid DNA-binding protein
MNKQELIEATARKSGLRPSEARMMLDATLKTLTTHLISDHTITLRGFGTFKTVLRRKRRFFSPTQNALMESPKKIVVSFKPSPILTDRLNGRRP